MTEHWSQPDLVVFIADSKGITSSIDQWLPTDQLPPHLEAAITWAENAGVPGTPMPILDVASHVTERWQSILNQPLPKGPEA